MRTLTCLALLAGTATASPRYDIDGDGDGFDDAALDSRLLYSAYVYRGAKGGLASTTPPL